MNHKCRLMLFPHVTESQIFNYWRSLPQRGKELFWKEKNFPKRRRRRRLNKIASASSDCLYLLIRRIDCTLHYKIIESRKEKPPLLTLHYKKQCRTLLELTVNQSRRCRSTMLLHLTTPQLVY